MSTRNDNFYLQKQVDPQKDSFYPKQETLFKYKMIQTYSNTKWCKPYRQAICVVKTAADGISKSLAHLWTANKALGK